MNGNAGRGAQDPLPRTITVVCEGFRFGLSLIAGAIVATGREEDPDGPWWLLDESLRLVALLEGSLVGVTTPEHDRMLQALAVVREAG